MLPNPSGLNAHETPVSLAAAYRAAAIAAGVIEQPETTTTAPGRMDLARPGAPEQ